MVDSEICSICKKPKQSSSGGLVTQFIDLCRCGELAFSMSKTISICSGCGKRVSGRSGSLTQWIFGPGLCSCIRSQPQERLVSEYRQTIDPLADNKDEVEIEVDLRQIPVDRFSVLMELGRGANGIVYLCRDRLLGKKVAVKSLYHLTAEQVVSFQAEARATARLKHPNIVQIFDFGSTEAGVPYMVMEYVQGIGLNSFIEQYGIMDSASAISIFSKLADALDYAHGMEILHRDIKPSNIVVFESEDALDVKLIDFGLAKWLNADDSENYKEVAGTPAYMPPEIGRKEIFDERSEIYSLGCVLFEALSGSAPFEGSSAIELLNKHVNEPPPDLEGLDENVNEELSLLVAKCLEKDRSQRFESMNKLKRELDEVSLYETTYNTIEEKDRPRFQLSPLFVSLVAFILFGVSVLWLTYSRSSGDDLLKDSKQNSVLVKPEFDSFPETRPDSTIDSVFKTLPTKPAFIEFDLTGDALNTIVGRNLEALFLFRCNVAEPTLTYISQVGRLERIRFHECRMNNENLLILKKCSFLKNMAIVNRELTGEGLSEITQLSFLEVLELEKFRLSNGFIKGLVGFDKLNRLVLNAILFDNCDLSEIYRIEKLKHLNLFECKLTRQSMAGIAKAGLNSLSINNCRLNNEDLSSLVKVNSIATLGFNNMILDEVALRAISAMKSLRSLSLDGCSIKDDNFLLRLTKLSNLRSLSLLQIELDSNKLKGLEKFGQLKSLFISSVNSDFFQMIKKTDLKELVITESKNVSDDLIMELAKMKSLNSLIIEDCPYVTIDVVARFKKVNSSCNVRIRDSAK